MDLSVVTVSYNVRELLAECLKSVQDSLADSALAYEIWVIDNASSDGSAEMVRRDFPTVRLIANRENRGFAAASNQGIAQAQGRFLLLLNPDTRVLGDAPSELVAFMEHTPDAGMAGGQLLYADGSFQHSAFRFPGLMQILLDFFPVHYRLLNSRINGRYPRQLYERGLPFPIDHPLGAAMIVRRETIERVGPMDERFFMYCEEIDWAMRMRRAGWKVYCVPRARIVHHVGQSTRQFREAMFVALWRSRFLLFEKHYSWLFRLLARWLVHLGLAAEERRLRRLNLSADELQARLRALQAVRQLR